MLLTISEEDFKLFRLLVLVANVLFEFMRALFSCPPTNLQSTSEVGLVFAQFSELVSCHSKVVTNGLLPPLQGVLCSYSLWDVSES